MLNLFIPGCIIRAHAHTEVQHSERMPATVEEETDKYGSHYVGVNEKDSATALLIYLPHFCDINRYAKTSLIKLSSSFQNEYTIYQPNICYMA
jgi:hypothetical protein